MVPSLQELAVVVDCTCVQFPWDHASSSRGKFLLQVYYASNGVETLFRILGDKNTQNIDTFTVHGWIARDYDTGKQLFIGKKRTFYPPKGTSIRKRHRAYITVPREYHGALWPSPPLGGVFRPCIDIAFKEENIYHDLFSGFSGLKHRCLWAAHDNQKWNVSLVCLFLLLPKKWKTFDSVSCGLPVPVRWREKASKGNIQFPVAACGPRMSVFKFSNNPKYITFIHT